VIVATIVYFIFVPGWATYKQYNALSAGRSAAFTNPLYGTAIAALALVLGGFLAGLSLGMLRHKKTSPAIADQPHGKP
jgi:hypothetical protein